MRVVETELFKYDELSEDAKEKARDWYRSADLCPMSQLDITQTLKAFEREFPVTAKNWRYGPDDYDVTPVFTEYECRENLKGARLVAYLINNHGRILTGSKVFGGSSSFFTPLELMRYRKTSHIKRVSNIIKGDTCCPFTGVCYDESILQPIRQFLKKPDGRTYGDLLGDCLDSLFHDAHKEWEAALQDDEVADSIRANEYEFTEDGEGV